MWKSKCTSLFHHSLTDFPENGYTRSKERIYYRRTADSCLTPAAPKRMTQACMRLKRSTFFSGPLASVGCSWHGRACIGQSSAARPVRRWRKKLLDRRGKAAEIRPVFSEVATTLDR